MEKEKKFILYRIYYGDDILYLGRTKQPLQDRIRGHLLKFGRRREKKKERGFVSSIKRNEENEARGKDNGRRILSFFRKDK